MANAKQKLLIVEDDGILQKLLVQIFSKSYEVMAASDGQEAIDLAFSIKPKAILLDLLLPKKDGFEVLAAIRQSSDQEVAKTPVIVLSNLYSNADILKAENLVISAYFVKAHTDIPVIEQKLAEVLAGS